jgi:Xaa-Pro dipeptidase
LDASINSDTRSAEPNRQSRAISRAHSAERVASEIRTRYEGRPLLLTTPGSVNWRTGGISDPIDLSASSDPVWTLDCDAGRVLITSEIEAPRLEADFSVREMGWDVFGAPWFDESVRRAFATQYADAPEGDLLSDAGDIGVDVRDALVSARLVLSEAEQEDLRELGAAVGVALGAGIDAWRPGASTDFDSAAAISMALESVGAHPVCLIVGGDGRLRSFRHPLAVGEVVHDAMMAVVVARRGGLHVAATRLAVRDAGDEIITLTKTLGSIFDSVLDASVPGGSWGDTLVALADAYESAGYPGAWREHFQGGPIGFEQREFEIAPTQIDSPYWSLIRRRHTAIAWNPSLSGGAKIEETYLVGDDGFEFLSATPGWPVVKGARGSLRSAVKVV